MPDTLSQQQEQIANDIVEFEKKHEIEESIVILRRNGSFEMLGSKDNTGVMQLLQVMIVDILSRASNFQSHTEIKP